MFAGFYPVLGTKINFASVLKILIKDKFCSGLSRREFTSCVLDLHSTTQVVSRLHATVLGKSCVV
jgi:hypothetical protein